MVGTQLLRLAYTVLVGWLACVVDSSDVLPQDELFLLLVSGVPSSALAQFFTQVAFLSIAIHGLILLL
jgi:hypothetical protein